MADRVMELLGTKALFKQLSVLEKRVQTKCLRDASKKALALVQAEVVSRVPVDTGALRDGLQLKSAVKAGKRSRGQVRLMLFLPDRERLQRYHDRAAKRVKQKPRNIVNDKGYYPAVVEFKGKSYLRAGFDAKEQAAHQEFNKALDAAIREATAT